MHNNRKKNRVPNCKRCPKKRVKLLPENYLVYSLYEEYYSIIMDGVGNVNSNMLIEIVNMYDLDPEERLTTIRLLITCFKTLKEKLGAKK
jgi:hypothetical protein